MLDPPIDLLIFSKVNDIRVYLFATQHTIAVQTIWNYFGMICYIYKFYACYASNILGTSDIRNGNPIFPVHCKQYVLALWKFSIMHICCICWNRTIWLAVQPISFIMLISLCIVNNSIQGNCYMNNHIKTWHLILLMIDLYIFVVILKLTLCRELKFESTTKLLIS